MKKRKIIKYVFSTRHFSYVHCSPKKYTYMYIYIYENIRRFIWLYYIKIITKFEYNVCIYFIFFFFFVSFFFFLYKSFEKSFSLNSILRGYTVIILRTYRFRSRTKRACRPSVEILIDISIHLHYPMLIDCVSIFDSTDR